MLGLYKFHWDCGRMGDLEGVFVADVDDVKATIGKEIDFGEALGKHSHIHGPLEEDDVELVSTDENVINIILSVLPLGTGYNPLNCIVEDEECDDEEADDEVD